jgi:hypothetical protein
MNKEVRSGSQADSLPQFPRRAASKRKAEVTMHLAQLAQHGQRRTLLTLLDSLRPDGKIHDQWEMIEVAWLSAKKYI